MRITEKRYAKLKWKKRNGNQERRSIFFSTFFHMGKWRRGSLSLFFTLLPSPYFINKIERDDLSFALHLSGFATPSFALALLSDWYQGLTTRLTVEVYGPEPQRFRSQPPQVRRHRTDRSARPRGFAPFTCAHGAGIGINKMPTNEGEGSNFLKYLPMLVVSFFVQSP